MANNGFSGVLWYNFRMKTLIMPHTHILKLLAERKPSMHYDGSEPFAAWQARARAKLAELLGLSQFEKCDEDFNVEYVAECESPRGLKYRETRFTIQTEAGYRMPGHFVEAVGGERPREPEMGGGCPRPPAPVVICLQGHNRGMHISLARTKWPEERVAGDRDFAIRAMREGYCALVFEQRAFGECGGDNARDGLPKCHETSMASIMYGRTMVGERVWDTQRAIDALRHFPSADADKIICLGQSGGGTTTLFTACIDTRVAFAIPSCYFCGFDAGHGAIFHCVCNFVPGMRKWFECGGMAGLVAPRPMVVVAGEQDDIFPIGSVKHEFIETQRHYAAAGAPDNVKLVIGPEGHRYYADLAWPVMNAFVK